MHRGGKPYLIRVQLTFYGSELVKNIKTWIYISRHQDSPLELIGLAESCCHSSPWSQTPYTFEL